MDHDALHVERGSDLSLKKRKAGLTDEYGNLTFG